MDGTHKLLSFPEFQDIHKAKDYLDTRCARDGIIAGYLSELKDPDPESAECQDSPPAAPGDPIMTEASHLGGTSCSR